MPGIGEFIVDGSHLGADKTLNSSVRVIPRDVYLVSIYDGSNPNPQNPNPNPPNPNPTPPNPNPNTLTLTLKL